jgi:hypothetical protein
MPYKNMADRTQRRLEKKSAEAAEEAEKKSAEEAAEAEKRNYHAEKQREYRQRLKMDQSLKSVATPASAKTVPASGPKCWTPKYSAFKISRPFPSEGRNRFAPGSAIKQTPRQAHVSALKRERFKTHGEGEMTAQADELASTETRKGIQELMSTLSGTVLSMAKIGAETILKNEADKRAAHKAARLELLAIGQQLDDEETAQQFYPDDEEDGAFHSTSNWDSPQQIQPNSGKFVLVLLLWDSIVLVIY